MKNATMPRAVLYAVACALALGALAFWPAKPWTTPKRPPLKAPIVFDELQNLPPASSDPSRAPQTP